MCNQIFITFFSDCDEFVVIDENDQKNIVDDHDNNINFNYQNFKLIVKHMIINVKIFFQTVF